MSLHEWGVVVVGTMVAGSVVCAFVLAYIVGLRLMRRGWQRRRVWTMAAAIVLMLAATLVATRVFGVW